MAYEPPFNPQVISPGRFRRFSGVSGEPTKVIKVADSNGRDLSDSFANDQFDLNADKKGELKLREGCIKIGDGVEASIGSIFQIYLGGNLQYGFVDIDLDIYPVPPIPYPNVPLPPEEPEVLPPDFPPTFPIPIPIPPLKDVPPDDPSVPLDGQACEDHHDHSTSPETLNFTMEYATPPANQSWYWMIRGWWPTTTHYGTYNTRVAWFMSYERGCWSWLEAACDWILQKSVEVAINGKDASGNWLDAGTYTTTDELHFTDGDSHVCAISLTVRRAIMSSGSAAIRIMLAGPEGGSYFTSIWQDITLTNAVADTTLSWTAEITVDASGCLDVEDSGSLSGIGSDSIALSLTDIPAAGTYPCTATFSGNGNPSTTGSSVSLVVLPAMVAVPYYFGYYIDNGTSKHIWTADDMPWNASLGCWRDNSAGENLRLFKDGTIYMNVWNGVETLIVTGSVVIDYNQDGNGYFTGEVDFDVTFPLSGATRKHTLVFANSSVRVYPSWW